MPPFIRGQLPEPVVGDFDVLVPVQLQHVSPLLVDREPPYHVLPVELQVHHLARVPEDPDELLGGQPVRQGLEGLGLVLRQRVVHVETNGPYGGHIQRPVAVDPPPVVLEVGPDLRIAGPRLVLRGPGRRGREEHVPSPVLLLQYGILLVVLGKAGGPGAQEPPRDRAQVHANKRRRREWTLRPRRHGRRPGKAHGDTAPRRTERSTE
mmetsp:Transcript_2029/g.6241  ORF Transcript_2029/g.6241 Transcript_2029/m.6241 type:complete len:208 (+) Transcript_2029:2716-3339(+)